jgi:hypothetical protein
VVLPTISAMKRGRSLFYVKISIAIFMLAFYCTGAVHELLGLCPHAADCKSDQGAHHADCAFCTLLRSPAVPACTVVLLLPAKTTVTTTADLADHAVTHQRPIPRLRSPPSSSVPS